MCNIAVAPLVGAWIEIVFISDYSFQMLSLLSWERGLKSVQITRTVVTVPVAPLVGAWIEILRLLWLRSSLIVAPLVGAWIEIFWLRISSRPPARSLLSWERGLKSSVPVALAINAPSLLSWERGLKSHLHRSTPFRRGRSSRGSVD